MSATPASNSSSGSPSPPPITLSTSSINESSPSPPQSPPPSSKGVPPPSTNSPPPPPSPEPPPSPSNSGSSPPSHSPPPSPPQNSTPPTLPPSSPPPTLVAPPLVSSPPAPTLTSPPPSSPSPPISPPQPTTPTPASGSSPPAEPLPPPISPPTNATTVVPTPYSPPSPAGSGPPSPIVPSFPYSPPSPPTSTNPSSSPSTPTTPGSNPSPPTGSAPTGGSGSSSPKSGSTPRSSSSSSTSTSSKPSTSSTNTAIAVGVAVASVFIIAIIATAFVFCKRKKRKVGAFGPQYMPPPNNFSMQSDGYYYGQKPQPADSVYASQIHHSPMANNSYGSQMMNGYSGGPYSGGGYSTGGPDSDVIGGGKSFFSYEEVMEITNGFSRQNVIGEGGFGCVYKGQLPDGKLVAVKQLKAGSGQGDREFRAEVEIISRVHHRHLVSLVGYSMADNQRLLIYEYLPNKTLEHHLHGKEMPVLDWSKRVKIALGSAKGLAYLHEDCHPKIIHRDIKSSNILLDNAFEAQVADFGLAKLTNDTKTHVSTRVMGTFGYLAPEYASSGKLTDRSDVFSFGVVLLELITGRKPVDPSQPLGDESLVEWARPLLINALDTGDCSELVDPKLEKHYVESEVMRMIEAAAACIRHNAAKRPRMAQVVRALDNEGDMSDLTNGVKFGQSTAYDSGQYNEDIKRFNRMALGTDDSSDYGYTGDYASREAPSETMSSWRSRDTSCESTSGESETRAINPDRRSRIK